MIKKIFIILFFSFFFPTSILANSPQSDYDFQLTQYRRQHSEFITLKQDYQNNPTLDNQQKALLSAKETIISREQAKIAYTEIILSSIATQKINNTLIIQSEQNLQTAKNFYKNQINLANHISNQTELSEFTKNYLIAQSIHQNNLIVAQAVRKLAILARTQVNLKNAFDALLPQLTNKSLPVSSGISQTTQLMGEIDKQIDANTKNILDSETTFSNKNNFFNKQISALGQIKNQQIRLINTIIDLSQNYVN